MNIKPKNRIKKNAALKTLLAFVLSVNVLASCAKTVDDSNTETNLNSDTTLTSNSAENTISSTLSISSISEIVSDTESFVSSEISEITEITENSVSETSSATTDDTTALSDFMNSITTDSSTAFISQSEIMTENISTTLPTTVATTVATTIPTTIAVAKTTTTTKKSTAPVVIPTIKAATSPGINTLKSDTGVIDYSNSSKGYFSAVYKGKSKKIKLRVTCGSSTYDHDLAADGTVEYYPFHAGSGTYTVGIYEENNKKYALVVTGEIKVTISNSNDVFSYPNHYVNYNQKSEVVNKAAEVCAGYKTDMEKITAIFKYITDNIVYDKQFAADVQSGKITQHIPNPDKTLSSKKGICFDYASLFAAMARTMGIPSKLVIGYASPQIYHAWNEVYTPETGWISVDVYLNKKGFNRVDATFFSSASDKKKIAEYIAENGNYSSMYYY